MCCQIRNKSVIYIKTIKCTSCLGKTKIYDIEQNYYHFAGQLIASHDGTDWNFFASDHLSSASLVMDTLEVVLSENRYMPYGEVRTDTSLTVITQTDFGYTSQRNYASFGLMDYHARFYSP